MISQFQPDDKNKFQFKLIQIGGKEVRQTIETHPPTTPHFTLFTKIPTMGARSFFLLINISFLICLGLSDKYLEFSHTNILIHDFSKIQILFSHSALPSDKPDLFS